MEIFIWLPSPSLIFTLENWDYIAMLKERVEEIRMFTAVN